MSTLCSQVRKMNSVEKMLNKKGKLILLIINKYKFSFHTSFQNGLQRYKCNNNLIYYV